MRENSPEKSHAYWNHINFIHRDLWMFVDDRNNVDTIEYCSITYQKLVFIDHNNFLQSS